MNKQGRVITTSERVIVSIVSCLLIFVTIVLSTVISGLTAFNLLTIWGLFVFIWILLSWKHITRKISSTYFIFVCCSLLFYWGQPLAYLLGENLNSLSVYSIMLYSFQECANTMKFIIIGYLLMHIGAVLFPYRKDIKAESAINVYDYSKEMNTFGKMMVVISVIPQLILIYNSMIAITMYGYIGLFLTTNTIAVNGGLLGVLSGFFIPGLFMLIIANSERIVVARRYSILCLVYIGVIFLLGRRGENTIFLLCLALIWHKKVKPFKRNSTIKITIAAFILMIILYFISGIRAHINEGNVMQIIMGAFSGVSIIDMIRDSFSEFGMTLLVPITVIAKVPASIPFYKGKTYLNFFLILLPNLFWETNPGLVDGTLESIVSPYIRNGLVGGMGGSFIAELYYNFGYYSYFLFPFIGHLLYKLNFPIDDEHNQNSKLMFFVLIYVFTNVLWVIRGEVMTNGKEILYFALFPAFIVYLLRVTRRKNII